MKKYRLIKEYPGSPKLGSTCKKDCNNRWVYSLDFSKSSSYYTLGDPENYPEFWEKVIEKDFEILSISWENKEGIEIYDTEAYINIESRIERGYQIHSVKRLSDGEVFTVGDKYSNKVAIKNNNFWVLTGFIIKNDNIFLLYDDKKLNCGINSAIKYKQPLFTTEDGVDIYEGDDFWYVNKKTFRKVRVCDYNRKLFRYEPHLEYYFSTEEAAEKYILYNIPRLSINDIIKSDWKIFKLKTLVKKKLSSPEV